MHYAIIIYNLVHMNMTCLPRIVPGVVAELIDRGTRMWEIESSVPGKVKDMVYKIDTFHQRQGYLVLPWTMPLSAFP